VKFRKSHILISFVVIILLGCSQQQKLLKTADNDTKYAAAMDYYDKHDYYRALQIFQQLINFYQGTEQAQKLQFRYAYCYYYQEDYVLASYYFKRFSENFPRSEYTEESTYMNA
jgi:outer membrane protein assembly factor BamD